MPVEGDRAGGGVVEAGQQLEHRGLPGAGLADEGHGLARVHAQVDAAQRLAGGRGRIAEPHAAQRDDAADVGQLPPATSGSGVSVSRAISSAMRCTDTRVCCHESNTCDSCWIGAKNRSM